MKFWRFFKRGYSSTISVTINLGDFSMLKISQTAPRYENTLNLLIESLRDIGIDKLTGNEGEVREKVKKYAHEVFGVMIDEKV